jgi:hypothetical protein
VLFIVTLPTFSGAAFVTVGLLSAALAALPKPDALLIYCPLFAVFYGARRWIKSELLRMMVQICDYQGAGT